VSNAFGFIQMRPGTRKQGYKRLLRGVRDEEVAGSNPVTRPLFPERNLITEVDLYQSAPHVVNVFLSSSLCVWVQCCIRYRHFCSTSVQDLSKPPQCLARVKSSASPGKPRTEPRRLIKETRSALKPTELIVFVVSVQGVLIASASPSCSGPAAALSRQRRGLQAPSGTGE
jgi:hypothetical protein